MKLNGTVTTQQTIEVQPYEIIEATMRLIKDKYPLFKEGYINPEKQWMVQTGFDPHKREYEYEKNRAATTQEWQAQDTLVFLSTLQTQ